MPEDVIDGFVNLGVAAAAFFVGRLALIADTRHSQAMFDVGNTTLI